jgi:hypothetical protein
MNQGIELEHLEVSTDRGFENGVLMKIFGQKMDEIIRGPIKLSNEELHNVYSSSNIIKEIK